MLRYFIVGFTTIFIAIVLYFLLIFYMNISKNTENKYNKNEVERTKTEIFTIAIFDQGKVNGYISFKAMLGLKDKNLMVSVSYQINDIIYRKLASFTALIDLPISQGLEEKIAGYLLANIQAQMGAETVTAIEVVELEYDRRIQKPD